MLAPRSIAAHAAATTSGRVACSGPIYASRGRRACVATRAYQIRCAQLPDIQQVADVCAQAFGYGNYPNLEQSEELQRLEDQYAKVIERTVVEKVGLALQRKDQAAVDHREYRARRTTLRLRAQLSLMRGDKHITLPTQPSPDEQRAEVRWRRARQFACLVAVDQGSGQVIGTAQLSLMQPEALLPAPFPSTAPFRAYIANMAVSDGHRRKGVARALLRACVQLARRWGEGSVWLHVNKSKPGALKLYMSEGFRRAPAGMLPTIKSLTGEILLTQSLAARASMCQRISSASAAAQHSQAAQAQLLAGAGSRSGPGGPGAAEAHGGRGNRPGGASEGKGSWQWGADDL